MDEFIGRDECRTTSEWGDKYVAQLAVSSTPSGLAWRSSARRSLLRRLDDFSKVPTAKLKIINNAQRQ